MSKKKIFQAVVIIYVVLVVGMYIYDFSKYETVEIEKINISQERAEKPVGEIIGRFKVGQTFYSTQDNFSGVYIKFATYNRNNMEDIIFHLKEEPGSRNDIYTTTFNGMKIIDNEFFKIEIPTIEDSKNKNYYFELESPKSMEGNAITVWSTNIDSYQGGSTHINRKPVEGDLSFKTFYKVKEKVLRKRKSE
ncbi:hypothetical protein QBE52_02595 [Clostridiaceae bacterium 35-E11]